MKVACINNMNNNMFALIRYLRDFGLDTTLFLFNNEFDHFLPCNDSFEDKSNLDIKVLSWGDAYSFSRTSAKKIRQDIEGYDITIGSDLSAAFLKKAQRRLNIFFTCGSDLYKRPFFKPVFRPNPVALLRNNLGKYLISTAQKKGIQETGLVISEGTNKFYLEAMKKLNLKSCSFINIPMVYAPEYRNIEKRASQLKHASDFLKIRNNNDVMILHHCRQIWKTHVDDVSYKGNDIFIKGFADYVKQTSKKAVLVLFEYGVDVDNSKQLIADLGIQGSVVWMPKMARKEIMFALNLADFGSDDILQGGIGGVGWEVMAMKRPLFINLDWLDRNEFTKKTGKPFPPVLSVKCSQDVTGHLLNNDLNPGYYKEIGIQAGNWFENCMGKGLAEKYLYLIETMASGKKIDHEKLRFA